jgi:cytochrome d ubiquinol oxidase subunit I
VLAAYLTTSFVVGGVGAWHLLRAREGSSGVQRALSSAPDRGGEARLMFSMAMWMAVCVAPLQVLAGDLHGLNTIEHQPMKVAAMEGHYQTREGAPLILLGLPDSDAARMHHALEVPKLGSLILKHDADAQVLGLEAWPRADWPNVPLVFWSFRVMVGLGLAMVGLGLWGLVARLRGRLHDSPALHRAALLLAPSGFVAVLAGWVVTEVGRQPFTVYGLLRTSESVSPIDAPAVAASLLAFVLVYFAVFGAGVFYMLRLMREDPAATQLPALHEIGLSAAIVPPRPLCGDAASDGGSASVEAR